MAVEPKIAIARILADLNLAVWYGIAIHIYMDNTCIYVHVHKRIIILLSMVYTV